jgi:phosphatidylserine/phosphatidylglycerophosphate/cardiolipin synthase-like enzyme
VTEMLAGRCQLRSALLLFTMLLVLSTRAVWAVEIRSCFTPGENCTGLIVQEIDRAHSELLVQAYQLTSVPIIEAMVRAKKRGVTVRVILDRSNENEEYTAATYLTNHGIEPLIDFQPAIAHNKIIIIDNVTVITGSFNFTKQAQNANAENVLVISDHSDSATAYVAYWKRRAAASRPYHRVAAALVPLLRRECLIKGNINRRNERIYHLPNSPGYKNTHIDERRGEKWFCTVQEAEAAGWRAPGP